VLLESSALLVCIAAMTHSEHIDYAVAIRDPVDHAPFADTNAPKVSGTFQFHNAGGTWGCLEGLNLFEDPPSDLGIKGLQLLAC
jgi:hypothetical protein